MKTKAMNLVALLGLSGLLIGVPANSELLSVAPSQSIILPTGSNGVTQVAFQFDLSGLPSGEGRRIHGATLEWAVEGTSDSEVSEFQIYPVGAAWSAARVSAQTQSLSIGSTAEASWEITPVDHDRGLGGLIRLDVLDMIEWWTIEPSSNHGVVMSTAGLSGEGLADQLASARLTIYYGFVR